MSGGQYLLGDYDKQRDKFVATAHGKFNFGASSPSGVHAPSATPDGKGGVIIIFNMNPGMKYEGWDQIMTLPRRLSLISENEIGIEPAGVIESLRREHQTIKSITLPANKEIVLENIKGNAMEINAQIDPGSAQMIEINVLRSPNKEEYTRIAIFPTKGIGAGRTYSKSSAEGRRRRVKLSMVTLETSYSSLLARAKSRPPETAPVLLMPDEKIKLRIFVDKSVVEVFINNRQCVAARVYPGREDSVGVSLRSQGRDSKLISLDAWQMENIYE